MRNEGRAYIVRSAFRLHPFGDRPAQPLSQIGVAARPVQDALQQSLTDELLAVQARLQDGRFLRREIRQIDASSDVERRQVRILDQIGGRSAAQQAEGQAVEVRLKGAPIVEGANGGEEIVRGEGKATNG